MHVPLGFCILCYVCVSTYAKYVHQIKDDAGRNKRSVPSLIGALLKKSKLIYVGKNYKVYGRPGGRQSASKDFDDLKPKRVTDYGTSKWGDVEGRIVMLNLDGPKPTLNIIAHETVIDGDVIRIMERVEYSENYRKGYFPLSSN